MKLRITLKDPDGVSCSLDNVGINQNEDYPDDVEKALKKFVKWSEYVTIEIDTETLTAKVIEVD